MASIPSDLLQIRSSLVPRVLVATVTGAMLVAALAWVTPSVEAVPGSYVLSGFKVIYPYDDPRTPELDRGFAEVSYVTAWSGTTYPGRADCEIFLHDDAGRTVGSLQTELTSYSREPVRGKSAPIPVSAKPVVAAGSC